MQTQKPVPASDDFKDGGEVLGLLGLRFSWGWFQLK